MAALRPDIVFQWRPPSWAGPTSTFPPAIASISSPSRRSRCLPPPHAGRTATLRPRLLDRRLRAALPGTNRRRPSGCSRQFRHAEADERGADQSATRRLGFIDGIAHRLPTIAIRPGPATHGNSGFFSNIIREPLEGRRAELPAASDVVHWIASPTSAVDYLLHAASIDTAKMGAQRALVMPGLAVSVAEELEALRAVGGGICNRTRLDQLDPPAHGRAAFPQSFAATRAHSLGFRPAEESFREIVASYLAEDKLR